VKFVVVDIETTGGRPDGNGITEIGIVHVEHRRITHQWSTFINPEKTIPYNIQMLTGISDEMVADAPTFAQIIPELLEQLKGDVFVAHSVNFDYSFIDAAFRVNGVSWRMSKLCTVKYSKVVFPEFGRYSLAHLARSLEVENDNPHRALSDALCAAEVLIHCINGDYDEKKLNDPKLGLLKRIQMPDHLPAAVFDELPKSHGVYEFLDAFGTPLYIGKANNIKSRITQHFSTQQGSTKYQRLMKECFDLKYTLLPNETLALIYEDHLIRQYWPPLNKAQKKQALKFGLYTYNNGKGETKWVIQKVIGSGALQRFGSYLAGQQWITAFKDALLAEGKTLEEGLELLKKQQEQRILLPLTPETGALFIENGSIVGIYSADDYLHNEHWVRENFTAVQPSPTINAIAMKLLDQKADRAILL